MRETVRRARGKESSSNSRHISILMPAHNEEECLRILLPSLLRTLAMLDHPNEAIVIDDGSHDLTRQIAAEHGLQVVTNNSRQGKGASIRQGIRFAKGNIIVTMDADGSNDPADLPVLLQPILNRTADVVLGSRFKKRFADSAPEPLIRRIGNAFFNTAIFLTTGYPVTDSQSGYRVFSRGVLDSIQTFTVGFDWETELLLKITRRGYRVAEVPIHYRARLAGASRLSLIGDSLKFLSLIIRNLLGTLD